MRRTKGSYEEYLNEVGDEMDSAQLQERFNLGRHVIRNHNLGSFLRRHDPIQFEVGYNEWRERK